MVDYAAAYLEAGDEVVEGAEELVALRGGRVLAEQPAHAVKLKLILILYIIICFKYNEDKNRNNRNIIILKNILQIISKVIIIII